MNYIAISLVVILILFTIALSVFSRRFTRTTADFYLAGRKVGTFTNASAISGDYLSAASFLGVAGAVYASGLDGVWYAAGFAGGFMVVVLFIAGPLRRFGEYTVADFSFGRFGTSRIRLLTVLAVLLTSLFYMAPQMFGAGTTWQILVGAGLFGMDPYTTGVVVVAAVMMFYVAVGGMKGTTLNQVFQFWWLWFAMFLVVIFSFGSGFNYPEALQAVSFDETGTGKKLVATKVMTIAELNAPIKNPNTGAVVVGDDGKPKTAYANAKKTMTPKSFASIEATMAANEGDAVWAKTAKVSVLLAQANKLHTMRVMLFNEPGHRYNWLDQFSMVLALVLGTAGLPHILNRYYTNPSGKAARRSTFWVLVFIGTFYIFAPIAGLAGRIFIPGAAEGALPPSAALVDGILVKSDQIMPALGQLLGGDWLMGIVAAGAFAAMFSTIGGLLIAAASAIGHDVYEKYINKEASEVKRVAVAKISVVAFSLVALGLGLVIPASGLDKAYPALIAMMVTWAFAVGGSAFVPMLLTGIWWKGTTERGAISGMAVGLGGSIIIIFLNIFVALKIIPSTGTLGFLGSLTFPTILIFPAALATIIIVSIIDKKKPVNLDEIWMRIHGTASERHERDADAAIAAQGGNLGKAK